MKKSDQIQKLLNVNYFQEWARSGFDSDHEFIHSKIHASFDNDAIEQAILTYKILRGQPSVLDLEKRNDLLASIHDSINQTTELTDKKTNTQPRFKISLQVMGIAASFIILLAVVFNFNQNIGTDFHTGFNETKIASLADGSMVTLKGNSRLDVIGDWDEDGKRIVRLENAAFFDVAKSDEIFNVQTALGDVEVLGTEFLVDIDMDKLLVVVKDGLVRVTPHDTNTDESHLLRAGDQLIFQQDQGVILTKVDQKEIDKRMSWMNGQMIFDQTSFSDLKIILEEQYGKTVHIHPSLLSSSRSLNGSFPSQSLPILLQSIETAFDVDIELSDDTIQVIYK